MTNNLVPLKDSLRLLIDSVSVEPSETYPIAGVYSFGRGLLSRAPILGSETTYKRFNRLHKDDFVLSQLKGWEGALAKVTSSHDGWFLSPQFPTFRANPNRLDISYLDWYCKQSKVWEELRNTARGMGARRDSVSPERFLALTIPLPPLPEQRRIVARIEELAAKISEARGLRQQAAGEAEALVTAQLRMAYSLQAKRYGSTRVEELIIEAGYGSSEKCSSERENDTVPVLRIPNVASELIDLHDLKFALLSVRDRERLRLANGDILVVRTNGSLDLVGRSAVIDDLPEPMAFASYMIRLRFDSSSIFPAYAQRMLRHLRMSGQLIDFARTTAGQYNVSLGRLRSAAIPVPPLARQHRIVAELDALQSQVDALKKLQSETTVELDALLPSILDKAFQGKL